jgi:hypothetical protein
MKKDKSAEKKLRDDAIKAAVKRRKAEVMMAEKLARAKAMAAKRLAEAKAKAKQQPAEAGASEEGLPVKPVKRAVRIDLMTEVRAERDRKRNDPVKRAAWIGGFCVSVMLLWVLKLQVDLRFGHSEYLRLATLYIKIHDKHAALTNELIASAAVEQKLRALDRLTTNRFLWAPLLNALQTIMVKDIQVIRLTGNQKYINEVARTIGTGSHKTVVPAAVVERISLYIQAKDSSSNELSYLDYKEGLGDCDYFVKYLRRRHEFILEGVLKPPAHGQSDPESQFNFFVLSSHFPDIRHSQ